MALFVDSFSGTAREVSYKGRHEEFLNEAYWLLGGEETRFLPVTKSWGIVFGKAKHHCGFSIDVGDERIFIANSGIFVGNNGGPVFNHFCDELRGSTDLTVGAACSITLNLRFWTQNIPWKLDHCGAQYLTNYLWK